MMEPTNLALFWAGVIAFSILIYVVLDGFDLGVGILFGATRDEEHRRQMLNTIAPFWDGNETWLVIIGASLYAAFPVVYSVFLAAFYIPVLLLLFGLVFRGVAFEFRERTERRWLWDWGFAIGSTVVAFVQGAAIGAMVRGIPVVDGHYAGRYVRLGASVSDFHGDRSRARLCVDRRKLARLQGRRAATGVGLRVDTEAGDRGARRDRARIRGRADARHRRRFTGNLRSRRWGLVFPAVAVAALVGVVVSARAHNELCRSR